MSVNFLKIYGRLSGTTWFVNARDNSSHCLPGQQMEQQIAIYDQGCELMVGASPLHLRTNGITFLDRVQVKFFTSLDDRCLT